MDYKWKYILPFVALCVHIAQSERSRDVYEYDECQKESQQSLGIGTGTIPDGAMWSSTNKPDGQANKARLNETGAWTAGTQNAFQFLGVDLGDRYMVTAVATQGRQGSDEYVTEYFLEYSEDRNTWRRYTNEFGILKMFVGNDNGWQAVQNTLHYPIVARYIRFNPQRWSMFISMRIEVYGCRYRKSEQSRDVYEYDECQKESQQSLGIGTGTIPDGAMWSSTNKPDGQANKARLNETGAWTAGTQNGFQFLGVDLGDRYMVTAVATQGRQGSDEYVTEYFLEYSEDRNTWRRYTNEFGILRMFVGNYNGWQTVQNTLHYPIVARYIRFNPQRWSMFISMRIEVYGCRYQAYSVSFPGDSFIQYNWSRQPVPSVDDVLELRFKTSKADGVLFYASGNQGDYIVLEMRRGFIYFRIDLGSTQTSRGQTEVKGGSLLDDHQWHDVVITRERQKLKVVVGRLVNEVETNGLFCRLDLDEYLFIGGVPHFNQEGIEVKSNFDGCVENVNFNGAKLIVEAQVRNSSAITKEGTVAYTCGVS